MYKMNIIITFVFIFFILCFYVQYDIGTVIFSINLCNKEQVNKLLLNHCLIIVTVKSIYHCKVWTGSKHVIYRWFYSMWFDVKVYNCSGLHTAQLVEHLHIPKCRNSWVQSSVDFLLQFGNKCGPPKWWTGNCKQYRVHPKEYGRDFQLGKWEGIWR